MKRNRVKSRLTLVVNRFWQLLMECYYCCAQRSNPPAARCYLQQVCGLKRASGRWAESFKGSAGVKLAKYAKHRVSLTQHTEGDWGFSGSTVQSLLGVSTTTTLCRLSTPSETCKYLNNNNNNNNNTAAASGHTAVKKCPNTGRGNKCGKCGHKLAKSDLPEQCIHICLMRREVQTSRFVAFTAHGRFRRRRTVTLRRPRWATN